MAQSVNYLGDQIYAVALPWLVYDQTRSGAAMAVCSAAGMVPYVVFGVLGGASADRGQRRRTLLVGNAIAAAAVAVMSAAGALHLRAPEGSDIIALALVLAAATSYAGSAAESSVPLIFPSGDALRRANAYLELSNSTSQVIGPALAGIIIAIFSASGALTVDAATFAFACGIFASLGPSLGLPSAGASGGSGRLPARQILKEWADGVGYTFSTRLLRAGITLSTCNNLALGAVDTLLILILRTRDGLSAEGVAAVLALGGLGAVVSAGILLPQIHVRFPGRVMVAAVATCGVAAAIIGEVRFVPAVAVCELCFGGAATTFNVTWRTLRQRVAERAMLGRVAGACRGIAYGGAALGALCNAGLLALGVPVTTLFTIEGILVTTVAAASARGALPRWQESKPSAPQSPDLETTEPKESASGPNSGSDSPESGSQG
jgi:hypothetical protein